MPGKRSAIFRPLTAAILVTAVAISAFGCTPTRQRAEPPAQHGAMMGEDTMREQMHPGMSPETMDPAKHHPAQAMGSQQTMGSQQAMGSRQAQLMQSMMTEMEACMNDMEMSDETGRDQMHAQMMARMQTCMEQMQGEEE